MPSRNDLSALKGKRSAETILPPNGSAPVPQPEKGRIKTKQIGRPKKERAEKRDYKITLSLTQAEGAKIAEKAGLAGDATYLYALLKEQGAFK